MKIILSTLLAVLMHSPTTLAKSTSTCPSAASIKAIGLTTAEGDSTTWTASNETGNKYGTPYLWFFMIGSADTINATKNSSSAMQKAIEAMQTLQYKDGPIEDKGMMICEYTTTNHAIGIAHTGRVTN